jgi:hypothetical protein
MLRRWRRELSKRLFPSPVPIDVGIEFLPDQRMNIVSLARATGL